MTFARVLSSKWQVLFDHFCIHQIAVVPVLLLVMGCLFPIIHSHTIAICTAVSEDQRVYIGASTYHTDTVLYGGALLTDSNGVTTQHNFTGWEEGDSASPPLRTISDILIRSNISTEYLLH